MVAVAMGTRITTECGRPPMATCEQCWELARMVAAWIGGPIDDHYRLVHARNQGEHQHKGVRRE